MVPRGVVPVRHPLPVRVLFAAAPAGFPRLDALARRGATSSGRPPRRRWPSARTPLVLTVHDRSWEARPRDFTRYERRGTGRRGRARWRGAPRASLCDAEAVRGRAARASGDWRRSACERSPLGPPPRPRRRPWPTPSGHPDAARRTSSSSAALEPRKAPDVLVDALPPRPGARARGRAGRRRRGPARPAGPGGAAARAGSTTSARSTPARWRSCCRRGSRASGCRRWRASRRARPRSSATCPSCARCSATARCTSRPGDAGALADALLAVARRPGRCARGCSSAGARRDRAAQLGRDRAADAGGARRGGRERRPVSAPFSIVVVLHDSAGALPALLASLRRLPSAPQLVVVDTASSDDGPALARAAGAEVVELGGNPGFGAANNAGVERARHAVTVLLNPDCELLDGVARPARAGGRRPTGALWVPRLLDPDGSVQRSAHPLPGHRRRAAARARPPAPAPGGAARPRGALSGGAAPQRRLGDRRLPRRAHRRAAPARPVRPAPVPLLRGHGPLPARPRGRDPDRARPGRARPPPRRPRHPPRLRRRAARAARPPPARGRAANRGPRGRRARRRRPGADVRHPRARAPGDRPRRRSRAGPARGACCEPVQNERRVDPGRSRHPTATPSSRWSARAASCTARGPTRPSAPDQFDELLSRCARDDFACFLVIDDESGEIAGVFNISQIVRGSFQSAFLGYYGSARHAGKGLMKRGPAARPRLRVRPALAPPHRGEHPARQRRLHRPRPRRGLPPRGLLAALPADRRPVARPRALRAHRRRAREGRRRASEQAELRLGRLLARSPRSPRPARAPRRSARARPAAPAGAAGRGRAASGRRAKSARSVSSSERV